MSAHFEFGPLERRGIFLGLRAGQLVVGLATTAAVVGVFSLWPSAAGAAIALSLVVLGGVTVVLPLAGRTVEQWAPVLVRHVAGGLDGSRTWLGPSNLRGHEVGGRSGGGFEVRDPSAPPTGEPARRTARNDDEPSNDDDGADRWVADVHRVDAGDALPPYLAGTQILAARWRQGDVGVLKDARRRTYVGVIAARGRSFALLDEDEKERLLAQWGSVLATAARESGVVTRVQWLERTVPDDSEAVVRHLRQHGALPQSSPFVSSYLALLDDAAPQTQQHEVFVALQVSAWRASGVVRQLGGRVDLGVCEVLSRELDAFAANLRRADIEVRGILGPRMLAAVLRQAVDPPAREQLAHRTAANPDTAGASPRNAFSRRSSTTWSTLQTEGACHATYWVSEWPRAAVDTDWMAPLLLGTRCRRSVSVVMEPVAPALALRRVEAARVDDETTHSLRQRFGFRKTVRKRREEENVARAEEELNEGHCAFRFSAYVTVTAPTRRELDIACADMEQQARQSRLDVRREYGLQDVAFTFTLPLCRGLR